MIHETQPDLRRSGSAADLDPARQTALPERPTRETAEDAVRTLIRYLGDDPSREGLIDTPSRVIRSYAEFFSGYDQDPETVLAPTFEEVGGYEEMVLVRDIEVSSHCEHHMVSFTGVAHVAYLPDQRVVGLSKLARLVDVFAKRLQIQEKLTAQVADTIERVLQPRGVAVVIEAVHNCMATRGVRKPDAKTITSRMTGELRSDPAARREFLAMVGLG